MAELPNNLGSIKDLKRRFSKAMEQQSLWHDQNDDVYDYFLPQRNQFTEERKGSKKMDHIFDSTPLQAIQEGASRLQDAIAPIWKQWSRVEPSDTIKSQFEENGGELDLGGGQTISIEQVQENLDKQTDIAFDYINRSNFSTQFYEMCLDLLVGTGTLDIQETDSLDEPFVFHAIPQNGIGLEEGPMGTIETHFRKWKIKYGMLERVFDGFDASQEVRQKIDNEPHSDCVCEGGIIFDPKDKRYYGVVWVAGEERASWVQDYEQSNPWVTGRYSKVAGEVRGRGPAMQVYPDARSLNKAKEFVLQKAAIDLAGMWTATDDGVTNPYNLTVSPGVVIPVGSNNSSNPSIMRLDTSNDLQLAQFEIVELQTAIKRAFFNDMRDPTGPVRSATEIAIEARDLAKRIGSAFGRLQTELLTPMLKRVFFILNKKGLINIDLQGFETTVKFTSPLARAQDQEDLLDIQQAVEFTMATAGPDYVKMNYKLENFGRYAGEKIGMPQELIRDDAEKRKIIEAGAQAAKQQMEQGRDVLAGDKQ